MKQFVKNFDITMSKVAGLIVILGGIFAISDDGYKVATFGIAAAMYGVKQVVNGFTKQPQNVSKE